MLPRRLLKSQSLTLVVTDGAQCQEYRSSSERLGGLTPRSSVGLVQLSVIPNRVDHYYLHDGDSGVAATYWECIVRIHPFVTLGIVQFHRVERIIGVAGI